MIKINNLDFAYKKKNNLFTDLDLNLPEGNIYGLLGRNGAGKTSLLKIITGLLFPQSGNCEVLGFQSSKRHPDMLAEIFLIPEEFHIPALKINEYVSLYSPFYPRFSMEDFRNNLNEFSISGNEKLASLSFGQKKKFLLSFGIASNTRILILDEPSNGLDIPGKSQFRKLLTSSINDDRIFLISTHQVRDIQQLIDPVIILDNGKIIFQQSMTLVNEKLSIQLIREEPDPEETLYYEKVMGGYSILRKDDSGSSTGVDLEMLFNAVVNNFEKINSVFRK
jgi:ABC-2 type transport system ATP-binding protein